ncbi:LacI family DNA-binding transcriptional regulator [Luoshenia tenuis]|uniref:LacI family DNA-binding transcriptional regulator n=1 Tax=Luoshenia tenuis TaxID=2763654 RepID=UPI003D8FCE10
MRKKRVTSSDIAKAVGVSQTTVSMILNKKYNTSFSRATVEKVERAAQELHYHRPRRRAKKTYTAQKLLMVLCPSLVNPYYTTLIQGVEEGAREHGYSVIVCNTGRVRKAEEDYLERIETLRPAGVIYMYYPLCQRRAEALAQRCPLVLVGAQGELEHIDAVALDSAKTGRLMAEHLLELGHRRVAFISTHIESQQPARLRRAEGFEEAFKAGASEGRVLVKVPHGEGDCLDDAQREYRTGYELTRELMAQDPDITAIAALNDMVALGVLDALLQLHYKVPQDISVIGCDNTMTARLQSVGLTTIEHFSLNKGRDAADIVFKKLTMAGADVPGDLAASNYHVEYEPYLVPRATTGPVRIAEK